MAGAVQPKRKQIDVQFEAHVGRVAPWLRRFGQKQIAKQLPKTGFGAQGTAKGDLLSPIVVADISATKLPYVGDLDAHVRYHGPRQTVNVENIHTSPLGGHVTGSAHLKLGRQTTITSLDLKGNGVTLRRVPGMEKLLGGTARFHVKGKGTLPRYDLTAQVEVEDLTVSGVKAGTASADVHVTHKGADIRSLKVVGDLGEVNVKGRVGFLDSALALDVELRRLALARIPGAGGPPLNLTGTGTVTAHVGGTTKRPQVSGTATVQSFGALGTMLGGARLYLTPTAKGVAIKGKLFQGKLGLDATVQLSAPYNVSAKLSFRRVEPRRGRAHARRLRHPRLGDRLRRGAERQKARGHAPPAGCAAADRPLRRPRAPAAAHREELGDEDVVIAYDGDSQRVTFKTPFRLGGVRGGGEVVIAGSASEKNLDLTLNGVVEMGFLDFYTRRFLDRMEGSVKLGVHVQGTSRIPASRGRSRSSTRRGRGCRGRTRRSRFRAGR